MKLTWFGGTTMRIHIGGQMLVIDAAGAPEGIDRTELVSGADMELSLAAMAALEPVNTATWSPRKVGALIDEAELPEVAVHRIGTSALVVDAAGEQPLLIVTGEVGRMGRWAGNAVAVVLGPHLPGLAANVLEQLAPRLLVIAGPEDAVDQAIQQVQSKLDGTGLMALEPGLALEV